MAAAELTEILKRPRPERPVCGGYFITDRMDALYWVCWGLILLEGLILAFFRWTCPLTLLARRHSSSTKDNFNIYLPNWLAKHTKTIYTVISVLILALTLYRLV